MDDRRRLHPVEGGTQRVAENPVLQQCWRAPAARAAASHAGRRRCTLAEPAIAGASSQAALASRMPATQAARHIRAVRRSERDVRSMTASARCTKLYCSAMDGSGTGSSMALPQPSHPGAGLAHVWPCSRTPGPRQIFISTGAAPVPPSFLLPRIFQLETILPRGAE